MVGANLGYNRAVAHVPGKANVRVAQLDGPIREWCCGPIGNKARHGLSMSIATRILAFMERYSPTVGKSASFEDPHTLLWPSGTRVEASAVEGASGLTKLTSTARHRVMVSQDRDHHLVLFDVAAARARRLSVGPRRSRHDAGARREPRSTAHARPATAARCTLTSRVQPAFRAVNAYRTDGDTLTH